MQCTYRSNSAEMCFGALLYSCHNPCMLDQTKVESENQLAERPNFFIHSQKPNPPTFYFFVSPLPSPNSIQKDKLNADLLKIPMFKNLGEKAKTDPVYIVGGGAVLTLLVMYFIFGAGLLCNLCGFVYPVYASIQALETKEKGDDTQWLTYWVIYAFFGLIEHFSDVILFWVPFYFSFKLGLLIWMMLPQQNGATFIYQAIRSRVAKPTAGASASGEPSASEGVYSDAN